MRGLNDQRLIEIDVTVNAEHVDVFFSRGAQAVEAQRIGVFIDDFAELRAEGLVLHVVHAALEDAFLHALPVTFAGIGDVPQSPATLALFGVDIVTDEDVHAQTLGMNGGYAGRSPRK